MEKRPTGICNSITCLQWLKRTICKLRLIITSKVDKYLWSIFRTRSMHFSFFSFPVDESGGSEANS